MVSDSFHTRLCVLPHDDRVLTVQCTRVLTVHDRTQGPVELYVICLLARFVYAQRLFEQIYFVTKFWHWSCWPLCLTEAEILIGYLYIGKANNRIQNYRCKYFDKLCMGLKFWHMFNKFTWFFMSIVFNFVSVNEEHDFHWKF